LGEIVSAPNTKLTRPLKGNYGSAAGSIIVRSEEVSQSKDIIQFQLKANKVDKKDFFGKSDPFLNFYRCNEDNSFTLVKRTEVIKNTLDPSWAPFEMPVRDLCNGDHDRTIKVECVDWDSDGSHDYIGEFTTNVRELVGDGTGGKSEFLLINKEKQKKKGSSYKNSGVLKVVKAVLQVRHSFLEFVSGGCDLNFSVAVDFTASNGNPTDTRSLHYNNPAQPNQYQQAMRAVGDIIQDYDADQLYPAYGFGARVPPVGGLSHCFSLNLDDRNPQCYGIHGLMTAYQNCINKVQ
jgi:hypothetical protein